MSEPIAKRRRLPTPRRIKDQPPTVGITEPDAPHRGNYGVTPKEFGAEVTRMRLARGWTQEEAGAALGVGKAAVALVESGKTRARPYMVAGFRAILRGNAP